jgi:MMPL family
VEAVYDVVQRLDDEPGYEAAVTGEEASDFDQEELSGEDLRTGELFFGLPTAVVILLLVFGAVVAGLVPLVLALVSILVALALAALLGQAFELSVYTVNMPSGMGLAVGVDYSLFVVSRYREERLRGREQLDAIAASGATASRTVLFSGMTFVLAVFGLLLVPNTLFRSLAAGAILAGLVSVLAALTLLPAVLGLLGDRINAGRIPFIGRTAEQAGSEGRFWGRGAGRARGHAPAGGQPRARRGVPPRAGAAGVAARDRLAERERPTRPLRVEAGLRAAERGVPRPDDRSRRDRGRRGWVPGPRAGGHRAARGRTRAAPDLRRAGGRDEPVRRRPSTHRADRRRPGRGAGYRCGARAAIGRDPTAGTRTARTIVASISSATATPNPIGMKLLGKWNWYLPGWLSWLPDACGGARRPGGLTQPAARPG